MNKSVSIYIFLMLLYVFSACSSKEETVVQDDRDEDRPSLVTQIQKCTRLYTTEYRIHKIVTHDDVLRLKGSLLSQGFDIPLPLGERKVAIPMDATLKAYIDFMGLTRSHFTDKELTNYEQQGRQAILNSIPQLGIVEQAQSNAARVLVPMLTEMGYKEENVTIAFRKNLDFSSLLDMNIEKLKN